ncbi:MAG: single-stranded DNA-binding protein [Verrucomicrobiota bacterium]
MPSLNKVMLIGNLTRDPEVRYTPKGTAVTDVSLALNRYFSGPDGERQEETTYVDVTLWGRQAEVAGQYLKKGRPVFIEGRLQMDQWQDKETGQNRSRLKVVGEGMQLLGGREGSGPSEPSEFSRPSSTSPSPAEGQTSPPPTPPATPVKEEDDDIPF